MLDGSPSGVPGLHSTQNGSPPHPQQPARPSQLLFTPSPSLSSPSYSHSLPLPASVLPPHPQIHPSAPSPSRQSPTHGPNTFMAMPASSPLAQPPQTQVQTIVEAQQRERDHLQMQMQNQAQRARQPPQQMIDPQRQGPTNGGGSGPAVSMHGGGAAPSMQNQQQAMILQQSIAALRNPQQSQVVQHLMKQNPGFVSLPYQDQLKRVSEIQVRSYFYFISQGVDAKATDGTF